MMPGPPYELYLIRHGLAEDRGEAWPDDAKRPLTDEGMSRVRKAARGLGRIGVSVEVVLTSPFIRSRQTAEIVAGGLDPRPSLVTVDSLAPDGTFAAVMADLEKQARKTRIALVGHEPAIGELAARLIGSRHPIEFKKGAVCRIDVDGLPPAGPGALRWMLTPKILRALKK
jgi:phosphohistidine phosphatase